MEKQESRDGEDEEEAELTSCLRLPSDTLMLLRFCSMVLKLCFFGFASFLAAPGPGLESGIEKGTNPTSKYGLGYPKGGRKPGICTTNCSGSELLRWDQLG